MFFMHRVAFRIYNILTYQKKEKNWNKQNILKTIAGQNSFITLDKIM